MLRFTVSNAPRASRWRSLHCTLRVFGVLLLLGRPAAGQTVVSTVPAGGNPIRVAVNSLTNRIYVTNWLDFSCAGTSSTLTVLNGTDLSVEASVPGPCHLWGLAVNEATNRVYIANYIDVRVIDGTLNEVVAQFQGGSNENSVAVNPVTDRVYVGTNNCVVPVVNVFNGANNAFIASVPVDGMPLYVAVNPVTDRIYVTKQYRCSGSTRIPSSTLSVIDGQTNAEIATIPVGTDLQGVAVNPTTNRIYVVNPATASVVIINGDTHAIEGSIGVGSSPRGVAVTPTTNHVYVANLFSNTVSAIDGVTGCRVTIVVGAGPQAVAANSETGRVYVANSGGGTLSVIDDPEGGIICDTLPPTWPSGSMLTAGNVRFTSVTLNWTTATDNVGVVGYKLFQDTAYLGAVSGTMFTQTVAGLTPCTEYTFKVEACDVEGNCSTDGPLARVSTLTPIEAVEAIVGHVDLLATLGVLNQGRRQALAVTLEGAAQQLARGNRTAALSQLQAFVAKVNALVSAGVLSAADAQLLIDAVNSVMAHPTCV